MQLYGDIVTSAVIHDKGGLGCHIQGQPLGGMFDDVDNTHNVFSDVLIATTEDGGEQFRHEAVLSFPLILVARFLAEMGTKKSVEAP
jgi:hypothetical protein